MPVRNQKSAKWKPEPAKTENEPKTNNWNAPADCDAVILMLVQNRSMTTDELVSTG